MICNFCRKAGKLTAKINRVPEGPVPMRVAARQRNRIKKATAWHERCPGGTWCDCQHFVGRALNMTLIAALAHGAEVKRSGTEAVTIDVPG